MTNLTRRPGETPDEWIDRCRAELRAEQGGYRANPEPDPADRALFSARRAASEEERVQVGRANPKSRDQLLLEAIQAEMRANPELAQAWKNAPGKISSN